MAGLSLLLVLGEHDVLVGWVTPISYGCVFCGPRPKVMKRVRTEQIQMAVSCYLKRRQYVDSDGPLKQGLRLSQTAEEMAANLTGKRGAAQTSSALQSHAQGHFSKPPSPSEGWIINCVCI